MTFANRTARVLGPYYEGEVPLGAVYILLQLALSYSLALVHLIPSWLDWQEIECKVHVSLTKWPIN